MSWSYGTTSSTFNGYQGGTTLTVTSGTCQPGYVISATGVITCTVLQQLTGSQNGPGTYTVSVAQNTIPVTYTAVIKTLTQFGTDTDLSGLAIMVGVTKFSGTLQTIYVLTATRINVTGTLNINPLIESLYYINSPFVEMGVQAGATLNINGSTVGSGGLTEYTTNNWMTTTRNCGGYNGGSTYTTNNGSLFVYGTLNWTGGTCLSDGNLFFAPGSTININTAYATWNGVATNSIFAYTSAVNYNGPFTTTGKRLATNTTGITLTGFAPKNGSTGLDGGTANQYLTLVDFQPYDNQVDIWHRSSNGRIVNGCSRGMSMIVQNPLTSGIAWQGVAILQRNVSQSVVDTANTPIVGAKIYAPSYDDSNRADLSAFGPALAIFNFTNVPAQNWTTIADGTAPSQLVKLKGWWVNNTTTAASSSKFTRFTKNADDNATYVFYACSYNHLLATSTVGLNGIGTYTNSMVLSADSSITQSNTATVLAYTTLNTAQQLYDYAKYYLYTNFSGQTSTYVSRSFDTINAGNYDVVLDPTAATPFSIVDNTMTIKATTFTGTIVTTGTITINAGASIPNGYTDSTGVHAALVVNNVVSGSRILIRRVDNNAVLINTIVAGTSYTYNYIYTTNVSVNIVIRNASASPYYQEWTTTTTLTATNSSVTANQVLDQ